MTDNENGCTLMKLEDRMKVMRGKVNGGGRNRQDGVVSDPTLSRYYPAANDRQQTWFSFNTNTT